MLGRIVLILLQVIVGWFATNAVMKFISIGDFRLFIFALVAAVIVFLIGVIAAQLLRDVGQPGSPTLSLSLVFALVAAALWTFGPSLVPQIPWGRIQAEYAVLVAAILGYLVKR
jgi:hypothetical protein